MFKKRLLPLCISFASVGLVPVQAIAQESADEQNDLGVILEEVVVQGVRQADVNARDMERDKKSFSSIIAQDDAGNFADQNVAESLQRLPGITLQKTEGEGRFVTVRGLGPGFVAVSMNGSEMASAGEDSRAFALDALPSDLLGSIEVFKSLTPDMDLNSIGGAVNVTSVSAFAANRDTLKISLQDSYQDYIGEHSPKVSLKGTNILADDTIGIGYALSHETRKTQVYENRHHSTSPPKIYRQHLPGMDKPNADSPTVIGPHQYEIREENAERTRVAGSFDVEYRPSDDHTFKFALSRTEFEDEDIALREYFRFDPATSEEIAFVNTETGQFGVVDAELQHQYFIQEAKSITTSFALSGESVFGDDLTVDYKFAHSKSEYDKPGGKRVQFRTRDLAMIGQAGKDYITGEVVTEAELRALGGYSFADSGDEETYNKDILHAEVNQSNMKYDNTFLEDSFRDDELDEFSLNIQKDFSDGFVNYVKAGVRIKNRERNRNKDRQSFDPTKTVTCDTADTTCLGLVAAYDDFKDANGITSSAAYRENFDSFTPDHPDFVYSFITRADTDALLAVTAPLGDYIGDTSTGNIDSTKEDYVITEDTSAAYLMAEFNLADDMTLIAGARYSNTESTSTGYFSIENDDFEFAGSSNAIDIAIPLDEASKSYNDILPSLHFRYEPSDEVLVRASLWTSFTRPSFNDMRMYAKIDSDIELCHPVTGECEDDDTSTTDIPISSYILAEDNRLDLGNPNLDPMTATNLDASIGWSPDDSLFLQAAIFYKDVKDFIVPISGAKLSIDQLPVDLPVDEVTQFTIPANLELSNVNYTDNGKSATVFGVELTYSQYFDNGLFVQSNLTLLDSEATLDDSVRFGDIPLPEQADETMNLTLGWENETMSFRLIGNSRSEVLWRIGACPREAGQSEAEALASSDCKKYSDIYEDGTFGLDFKATYSFTDNVQGYFNAINLTEDESLRYFAGDSRGNLLYQKERYGSSFQLGVNIDLY